MKLINSLIDTAAMSSKLRALMRYAWSRSEGLQYDSYKLADEVALASSFLNNFLKGKKERSGGGVGVVIDAGANKGEWSSELLKSKPIIQKLIVIEPQGIHVPTLQKLNVDNFQIVVEQIAIGATPGELTLHTNHEGSELASLYKRDITHFELIMSQQEVVRVTTLDALAEKHAIQHVTFLKLDLEGHELEALKGAKNLLERKAIDAIMFEFGGCNIDSRTFFKDFWSLLVSQHQFSLYRLLPQQRLKYLSKYSESLEQFSWQNILACASNIKPKWKVLC
jgi:FkbM family methyltransferase